MLTKQHTMNITGNTKGGDTKPSKVIKPVKNVDDEALEEKPKPLKTSNIAKKREEQEQPVHSIKKAPKEDKTPE